MIFWSFIIFSKSKSNSRYLVLQLRALLDSNNNSHHVFFAGFASMDNGSNLERSSVENRTSRLASASLPEILRETTLLEFLEAIERVRTSQFLNEHFDSSHLIQGKNLQCENWRILQPNRFYVKLTCGVSRCSGTLSHFLSGAFREQILIKIQSLVKLYSNKVLSNFRQSSSYVRDKSW